MRLNKNVLVVFAAILMCSSLFAAPKKAKKPVKESPFLKAEHVSGKVYEGEVNGKQIKYEINSDNTLIKTIDGVSYNGAWSFDESLYPLMSFDFSWTEGENKNGYLVSIMKTDDGKVAFNGHWYITDAYITMYEVLSEVVPEVVETAETIEVTE